MIAGRRSYELGAVSLEIKGYSGGRVIHTDSKKDAAIAYEALVHLGELVFEQVDEDPAKPCYWQPQFKSSLTSKGEEWSTKWMKLGNELVVFVSSDSEDIDFRTSFTIRVRIDADREVFARELIEKALSVPHECFLWMHKISDEGNVDAVPFYMETIPGIQLVSHTCPIQLMAIRQGEEEKRRCLQNWIRRKDLALYTESLKAPDPRAGFRSTANITALRILSRVIMQFV